MCGIAGFWGDLARQVDAAARLERMTTSLEHRGPDGTRQWIGRDVGLGHTRLAIIDIAGGDQPMWSADGGTVIVFNGEIYNYEELRSTLAKSGYAFQTRSDTEVIGAAIEVWGLERGLLSLRGMFAFALYDTRTHRLVLARDRVGIKPMYWAQSGETVLFGSEPKALLAAEVLPRRMNVEAIHDFLGHGYATTPATCWKDIHMLEPGTWLECGPTGLRRGRYWQWSSREAPITLQAAAESTRTTLLDAARAHLVSDVPVGAFLSGGLDSSLLVRLLSPDVAPGLPTFNVGFGDPAYDESAAAARVAEVCGTSHHALHLADRQASPELFETILSQYDEPFGDSSCIPVYLICREMRRHVKVVLSGDGGDEVLGGYPRYLHARRLAALARWRRLTAPLGAVGRMARHGGGEWGRRMHKAWQLSRLAPVQRLSALQEYFTEAERIGMYQPDVAVTATARGPTWSRFAAFVPDEVADPALQLMTAEMRLRLHADYLRKVDVASAAHGVEVRVPYLDNQMLDLGARLPTPFKVTNRGETKVVSRHLARRLLPAGLADAPKMGFSIPLDRWFGEEMRDYLRALLLDTGAPIRELLQPSSIGQIWKTFETGDSADLSRYQRYQRLFLVGSLALWLRRWRPSS
jgi:asparagine synthase (glutamine-hydrolysing)